MHIQQYCNKAMICLNVVAHWIVGGVQINSRSRGGSAKMHETRRNVKTNVTGGYTCIHKVSPVYHFIPWNLNVSPILLMVTSYWAIGAEDNAGSGVGWTPANYSVQIMHFHANMTHFTGNNLRAKIWILKLRVECYSYNAPIIIILLL
jgi:hypothetical protein